MLTPKVLTSIPLRLDYFFIPGFCGYFFATASSAIIIDGSL
jgi:hypothetical protein